MYPCCWEMQAKQNVYKFHHATGCSLSRGCLFSAFFNFVELKRSQQPLCQRALYVTIVFSNSSPSSSNARSFCIGMQSRSLNFTIFPARVLWTDPTSWSCLSLELLTLFSTSLRKIQVSDVKIKYNNVYTQYIFLHCNTWLVQIELTKSKIETTPPTTSTQ